MVLIKNTMSTSENIDSEKVLNDVVSTFTDTTLSSAIDHPVNENSADEADERKLFTDNNVDVDSAGDSFDTSIHSVDKNGSPRLSKITGKFIKKRGKSKVVSSSESDTKKSDARTAGVCASNLFVQASILFFGDKWHPVVDPKKNIDEKSLLDTAFSDYFEATGVVDIPPGLTLAFVICAYASQRCNKSVIRDRFFKIKNYVSKKFFSKKIEIVKDK